MKARLNALVEDIVKLLFRESVDTPASISKEYNLSEDSEDVLEFAQRRIDQLEKKVLDYSSGIIPASRNQLGNVSNRYQTDAKRVLTVCSAGLLRSPTAANVLHQNLKYNTRSCGAALDFALIPITEALIAWSDEIVFVSRSNLRDTQDLFEKQLKGKSIVVLDIPDNYEWNDETLREIILEQYINSKPYKFGENTK